MIQEVRAHCPKKNVLIWKVCGLNSILNQFPWAQESKKVEKVRCIPTLLHGIMLSEMS